METSTTRKKIEMKKKLQVSKNVTINKPDENPLHHRDVLARRDCARTHSRDAPRAKEHAAPARRHHRQRTCSGAGDRRSESRGRSCSRSGKGRLHRQSPSCQKTVGSETFLPSAVVQRSCKILGAAADRTTNAARRPLCPNLQQWMVSNI